MEYKHADEYNGETFNLNGMDAMDTINDFDWDSLVYNTQEFQEVFQNNGFIDIDDCESEVNDTNNYPLSFDEWQQLVDSSANMVIRENQQHCSRVIDPSTILPLYYISRQEQQEKQVKQERFNLNDPEDICENPGTMVAKLTAIANLSSVNMCEHYDEIYDYDSHSESSFNDDYDEYYYDSLV